MDDETKNRISDFFSPSEIAEYLGISTRDILDAFPDEVEDALSEIEELMEFYRG